MKAPGRLSAVPSRGAEQSTSRPSTWRERARAAPVTTCLVSLCALAFLVTLILVASQSEQPLRSLLRSLWSIDSDAGLVQLGALDLTRVWIDGEWWRLGSAALLHGSWLHLLLNMSALASIGEWLEPALGSRNTLLIFVLSALGGSLASLAWCEAPVVVGASGGILGLAGALLFARVFAEERGDLRNVSAGSLALMIGLCLGLGLVVPVIAQAGHVGGLIAGTFGAMAVLLRGPLRVVSLVATVASFVLVTLWGSAPTETTNYHLFLGYRHLDDGADPEALASFEAALALDPADPKLSNAVAYHLAIAGSELDRADQLVDRALADDPNNADYLDTKGWIACQEGDSAQGLKWLRAAEAATDREIDEITEHLASCAGQDAAP